MNGALEILKRERDDAVEQIRVLRVRIRDLEAAIGVLDAQPAKEKTSRAGGDLKANVLTKLHQLSGGATPRELADDFTRDGRPTSDASVSSTLSRLKAEAKVSNHNGKWFVVIASTKQAKEITGDHKPWLDDDEEIPF